MTSKCDHVDKNHQENQQYNHHKHGNEVEYEEPGDSPEGSNETRQSHNQDQNADDYDGPL